MSVILAILWESELSGRVHEAFGSAEDIVELLAEGVEDRGRRFEHPDLIPVPVSIVFEDSVRLVEYPNPDCDQVDE